MNKLTPFLWFNDQAEEAARFYTAVFKNAKLGEVSPMATSFELEGVGFTAFNGGPRFSFTEAISLYVNCETQGEVDYYWERLGEGGKEQQCGWLKDKFGISWQIIPSLLPKLFSSPDRERANRAVQAMLQMTKIDMAKLQEAYDG
ncbi:VOC family protein [Bosea caraganae]|uniref:VOC family protein n=1 Tax=Bosea caraganae TaxID=2763117 RepID=A0A370LCI2_9HYPH|nr:VOC family protein [Bosea caraganae]RDJ27661.1 VOC family protein [Bosea caraganae]RDJ29674.1 VOC family protein [Bosea caraganae]